MLTMTNADPFTNLIYSSTAITKIRFLAMIPTGKDDLASAPHSSGTAYKKKKKHFGIVTCPQL